MAAKIFNILFIIIGTISAVAFMTITHNGFQQKFILKHFSIKDTQSNDDNKTSLLLKYGFYFALFSITLKIINLILSLFDIFKPITLTIQRVLLNSYDYFIIFALLLFYMLRNSTVTNMKQTIPLYGFWFFSARIIYTLGYLLTTFTGLNFKVPGVALTYALLALMIASSFGLNAFKFFNLMESYIPQL